MKLDWLCGKFVPELEVRVIDGVGHVVDTTAGSIVEQEISFTVKDWSFLRHPDVCEIEVY